MINTNNDQDEWTNSLSLGSSWTQRCSGYEYPDTNPDYGTRIESRYRKNPDLKLRTELDTKESWHESRAEFRSSRTRSLDTKGRAEIQTFEDQFQDHLLKKDQFVDDLFIIYLYQENQPDQFVVVNVTSHGRTTQFFQPNISVWVQVMKFLYFNIDSQTSLE